MSIPMDTLIRASNDAVDQIEWFNGSKLFAVLLGVLVLVLVVTGIGVSSKSGKSSIRKAFEWAGVNIIVVFMVGLAATGALFLSVTNVGSDLFGSGGSSDSQEE